MNTVFMLMAQYEGRAMIPLDRVCKDYFPHLSVEHFLRKQTQGEIAIPVMRMEESQKSTKGVFLTDLAAYLDKRREIALKEHAALHS